MTTLFTIRSTTEGRFGQGTVPADLHGILDEIATLFFDGLPPGRRAAATHHAWCRSSPPRLRALVERVKRHPLWEGDFVAFDFDRARHRVANLPGAPEDGHRILLKLHFCVSPAGRLAAAYAWGAHRAYVVYEALTRRVMALGTEPQTVPQFAAGLLGQFAVRHPRLVLASAAVPLVASGCAAVATGLVIAWIAAAWWQWSRYRSASARAVQARE